ncbi:MAG: hypothetical protein KDA88_21800 [Planctomycetaceae bacterium]|nr:hypothetical protein [Planctomycetaceae bacterium]MCB9952342.1 hypothetical protein [Planctomycetaceae bacterium]
MNVLRNRIGGLLMTVCGSAFICLLAAQWYYGEAPVLEIALSHIILMVVGIGALFSMHGRTVSYESIMATTGIRTVGTCVLAGSLLLLFPRLRTELFILPVAVAYLAVLGYETWLGTRQLHEGGSTSSSKVPDSTATKPQNEVNSPEN